MSALFEVLKVTSFVDPDNQSRNGGIMEEWMVAGCERRVHEIKNGV